MGEYEFKPNQFVIVKRDLKIFSNSVDGNTDFIPANSRATVENVSDAYDSLQWVEIFVVSGNGLAHWIKVDSGDLEPANAPD